MLRGAAVVMWLVRVVATALIVCALAACGAGPDHYVSVLDQLEVPVGWDLVYVSVRSPGGGDVSADPSVPRQLIDSVLAGPSFGRYYLGGATPTANYAVVKQMLDDAGFVIDMDTGAECSLPPADAACVISGHRDGDKVTAEIYRAGDDSPNLGIADPKRSTVSLVAEKETAR